MLLDIVLLRDPTTPRRVNGPAPARFERFAEIPDVKVGGVARLGGHWPAGREVGLIDRVVLTDQRDVIATVEVWPEAEFDTRLALRQHRGASIEFLRGTASTWEASTTGGELDTEVIGRGAVIDGLLLACPDPARTDTRALEPPPWGGWTRSRSRGWGTGDAQVEKLLATRYGAPPENGDIGRRTVHGHGGRVLAMR